MGLVEVIARSTAPAGAVDLGWGHAHVRAGAAHLEADSRVVVAAWPVPPGEVLAAVEGAMAGLAVRRLEVWDPEPPAPGAPGTTSGSAGAVLGAGAPDGLAGAARSDETVLVLAPDRPAPADVAAAGAAVDAVAGVAAVRLLSAAVVQVAVVAGGETVSLCHLQAHATAGPVEIEGVQTVPAWRHRGLGAAVVTMAAAHARAAGAGILWLRTARDGPAERLYRRLGFEPVGVVTTLRWTPLRAG